MDEPTGPSACHRHAAAQPGVSGRPCTTAAHQNGGDGEIRSAGGHARATGPTVRAHAHAVTLPDGKPVGAAGDPACCPGASPAVAQQVRAALAAAAAHEEARRYHDAVACFSVAIALDPGCSEAYSRAGSALKELGDLAGAIRMYQRSVELQPSGDVHLAHGIALQLHGDRAAACEAYKKALQLDGTLTDAWINLGVIYKCHGSLDPARKCFTEAVRLKPMASAAWLGLAGVAKASGDGPTGAALLQCATSLLPRAPELLMALGWQLRDLRRFAEAAAAFQRLTELTPTSALAHINAAACHHDAGNAVGAVHAYCKALQLDPGNPDCLNNLGNAYRELGSTEEAIRCYTHALRVNQSHPHAWNNLGNALKDKGALPDAVSCYRQACSVMPDFAAAHSNLASALKEQGMLQLAMAEYREALRCDVTFADAWSNLGNTLKDLGRLEDAVRCYSTALHYRPAFVEAYWNLASAFKDGGKIVESVACYERVLALRPDAVDAFCNMVHSLVLVCNWSNRKEHFRKLASILSTQVSRLLGPAVGHAAFGGEGAGSDEGKRFDVTGLPSVQPFHSLVYPMSLLQMQVLAQCYARKAARCAAQYAPRGYTFPRVLAAYPDRIRVGYVSSDFGNHPLSHLMQSVFGLHDRATFEVFCYALSAEDGSAWRAKIRDEVEHFVDVSLLDAGAIADTIAADCVHVLVNLNGYTRGAKNEIFALRPAPIQVSYLGFCGTLGADYIDYLVADRVVIPPGAEAYYNEKIVYMPHSYFVNDHKRSAAFVLDKSRLPSRAEIGLPAGAFVFANFNQIYKLDPLTLKTWCSILNRVPDSVLWLLRFPPAGEENIRRAAAAFGIPASRIIFTDVANKDDHLRRSPLADLFLDTLVCNAHTTGCDVLWGAVPLLTVPGTKMASRVAASLLTAMGAEECICSDLASYEDKAVFYATHRGALAKLRASLEARRLTAPLFDTARWVRNFERAALAMIARYNDDMPPSHIVVEETPGRGSGHTKWAEVVHVLEGAMQAPQPGSSTAAEVMDEAQQAIQSFWPVQSAPSHAFALPAPLLEPPHCVPPCSVVPGVAASSMAPLLPILTPLGPALSPGHIRSWMSPVGSTTSVPFFPAPPGMGTPHVHGAPPPPSAAPLRAWPTPQLTDMLSYPVPRALPTSLTLPGQYGPGTHSSQPPLAGVVRSRTDFTILRERKRHQREMEPYHVASPTLKSQLPAHIFSPSEPPFEQWPL